MRLPCLTLTLALLSPLPLLAADWQQLQNQSNQALQAGRLDEALALARQALNEAENKHGKDSAYAASSLNDLALIESNRGNHAQALELITRAAEISAKALGAEHDNTVALLLNQGLLAQAAQNHPQAIESLSRYLEIQTRRKGASDPSLLRALNALSYSQLAQSDSAGAERSARQALAILASQDAPDVLLQATSYDDLALALQGQQQAEGAADALRQALELRRARLGESTEVATSLDRLARQYDALGRHAEALPLRREAMAILEKLEPEGMALAQHLNELAMDHHQREEYDQAEPLYRRSLAILQKQRGEDSIETALLLGSLGRLKQAQRDEKAALELFQRSLAVHQKNPSQPLYHAQVLSDRAMLYYAKRRFNEAEADFLQSLELQESVLGVDNPGLLSTLENLVALYRSQGQNSKAVPYAKRVQELRKRG